MTIAVATLNGASAKMSENETARIAQQKSGTRLSDIPGARSLKIVVTKLIDAAIDEVLLNSSPSA